jgi:ATP-dependent helicase/nuclease subunit A
MSMQADAASRSAALDIDRSIVLQAPAGSGKTTVLVQRFLKALANAQEPEEVLAITFTRKAAAEMRDRVLRALEQDFASTTHDPTLWAALREGVMQTARQLGWALPELPARLRIQTIDSLNHEIARAMPLLGRMQSNLAVVDDATDLYRRAAVETLQWIETHPEHHADADLLLSRLDNNLERAADLLAELLPARNRWQEVLLACPPEDLAGRVAASLARISREVLTTAMDSIPVALRSEASALATASAENRRAANQVLANPWQVWLAPEATLAAEAEHLLAWQAIVALALKDSEAVPGDGRWRKEVDVRLGFPRDQAALKQRWRQWCAAMRTLPGMEALLIQIEQLPSLQLDEREGQALAALARVMLLAAANLKLVFRAHGHVDHKWRLSPARHCAMPWARHPWRCAKHYASVIC